MSKKGCLVVISGFSGSGKGTAMKALLSKYNKLYALSISATTRKPREGETDGVEYFFKTKEEFEAMIQAGELLEYAQYVDNYYGTPRKYVEQKLDEGKNVILEIETKGALKVKRMFPETVLIFLAPPTAKELADRLYGRGTESNEIVQKRLNQAIKEVSLINDYDYLVINDKIEDCVEKIHQIVLAEQQKTANNREMIQGMNQDLSRFLKGE